MVSHSIESRPSATTDNTAINHLNDRPASGPKIIESAKAWLSIGGRIWIDPDNRLGSMISADRLFSLKLSGEEAERRMAISRAYNVTEATHAATVATLVRQYGEPTSNGFLVWEGR